MDRARAACRAAFERVRAWYDRTRNTLDGRLKSALDAVGRGSAAARRGTGHLARARIDDLAQLVTDYAAQHEQHAAALEKQATAWQAQQQQLDTQVGES